MELAGYLKRIGFEDLIDVRDDVLFDLHRKHVYAVPFENLDVYQRNLFGLELDEIYNKIVDRRRGGFCYELNLLFHWLVTEIGFESWLIEARIFKEDGTIGPPFDHMALVVRTSKDFLVDVGYGDLFLTPIEIRTGAQSDGRNYFQIDLSKESEFVLSMSPDGVHFSKRYAFSTEAVNVSDFADICLAKQTDPDSYFVQNVVCTKPTENGRMTIFNHRFVERRGSLKEETLLQSDDDLKRCLKDKFGLSFM